MHDILRQSLKIIENNNTSTFFVYGSLGAGKTTLLQNLCSKLLVSNFVANCLGPYQLSWNNTGNFIDSVLADCEEFGLIQNVKPNIVGLTDLFEWLPYNIDTRSSNLVLLIDLNDTELVETSKIATLFSCARNLDANWSLGRGKLHIVFAGFWNIIKLDLYCKEVNISFPYTVGNNFSFYHGLTNEEISQLVLKRYPNAKPLHGYIIHELIDGHPTICHELFDTIGTKDIGIKLILNAIHHAAQHGSFGNRMLNFCNQLPPFGKEFLSELLVKRHVRSDGNQILRQQLVGAGLLKEAIRGSFKYVTFRSWYIELLLRYRGSTIGIQSDQSNLIPISELMPDTRILNETAYKIIYDIENQVRNFAVIHANIHSQSDGHFLDFEVKFGEGKREKKVNVYEEPQKRKTNSIETVPSVTLNPIIAFLYTRELAAVVHRLADSMQSESWRKIGTSLNRVANIRNSVMHNQIIDETQLDKLLELQDDIYRALNETD